MGVRDGHKICGISEIQKFHSAYKVIFTFLYAIAVAKTLEAFSDQILIGRARGPGRPKKTLPRTAVVVESRDELENLPHNK